MSPPFLPYGRQVIDADDVAAVAAAVRAPLITTGPYVEAFEAELARLSGARHVVACSSGTAALHLSALALGLGVGDTVVVPAVTFAATANAVRHSGAEVVFADVDPDSGLMTPATLAAVVDAAGRRLSAVYSVHFAGQCRELPAVRQIAEERGLAVVEDAAHAIGGAYAAARGEWIPVGACRHSEMTVFSFHPVKTVTSGEGGAVTTNDARLAERVRLLRNHGIVRDGQAFQEKEFALATDGSANPWHYEIAEIGFNYRITDIQCALGLSQLGKLAGFVARREALIARYRTALAPLAPLVRPLAAVPGCRPGWHLCVVLIDFAAAGVDRAAVMRRLAAAGIGSQVHYLPLHLQPYYRRRYGAQRLPGAEAYYARCLSLPLFPAMSEADVDRVVDALAGIVGRNA